MKTFEQWLSENEPTTEGWLRNAAIGGLAGLAGLAVAATPARAGDGFADNPKVVVQQRADQMMGFQIKKIDDKTVHIIYRTDRMTDEQAMERAIQRLPGGYDQWQPSGSSEMSGSGWSTLIMSSK